MQKVDEAARTPDPSNPGTGVTSVSRRRSQARAAIYLALALVLSLACFVAFQVFNATVFFVNLLLVCAVISDPSRV
jgi:hypothetical protein